MLKVFISYRRADSANVTDNIYEHMERHFGEENVFLDVGDIPPGVDFRQYLRDQIATHDVVMVIIGTDWSRIMQERANQANDFVRIEIENALAMGKHIVPILVNGTQMPDFSQLPAGIANLQWLNAVEVRRYPNLKSDCQRIADGIKKYMDSVRYKSDYIELDAFFDESPPVELLEEYEEADVLSNQIDESLRVEQAEQLTQQYTIASEQTEASQPQAEQPTTPSTTQSPQHKSSSKPQPTPRRKPLSKDIEDYMTSAKFDWIPQPSANEMKHPEWWYTEHDQASQQGVILNSYQDWVMAGASRRGLSHENKGTPRDDAFKLSSSGEWNIMVMSDGAGGSQYSRVTANESCVLAIQLLEEFANITPSDTKDAVEYIQSSIQQTLRQIYKLQHNILKKYHFKKAEAYCTFLIIVHQPLDNEKCLFGFAHIGDGMIYVASSNESRILSQGMKGQQSNETEFVLSLSEQEVISRARAVSTDANLNFFMLITDGISDDLLPTSAQYNKGARIEDRTNAFIEDIRSNHLVWPCYKDWGTILDWVINYERDGSFDDRSIAILALKPQSHNCP